MSGFSNEPFRLTFKSDFSDDFEFFGHLPDSFGNHALICPRFGSGIYQGWHTKTGFFEILQSAVDRNLATKDLGSNLVENEFYRDRAGTPFQFCQHTKPRSE